MPTEPPWLTGERAARAIRHELGLGFAPVDIWDVLRRRGVSVALHDFGAEGGDGVYLWRGGESGGVALIVVNSAKRPSRQRFTAAHELGHHELHRFEGADVVIADEEVGESDGDEREVAANAFAAYLLAPVEDLREWFKLLNGVPSPAKLVELMRRYGLSYQAVAYRLRNSGLITQKVLDELLTAGEGQIERLSKQQGFSEFAILPPPAAVPEVLSRGAMLLYREHVITEARLAELLGLPVEEALGAVADAGMGRSAEPPVDARAIEELLG
jgi:Zn-dependent peptidase ImmA (M78 family)